MHIRIPHPWKLSLFAMLSATDAALTWRLLDRPDAPVYEMNPLARWFLEQLGWPGLIGFKAVLVGVVSLAVVFIARYRPCTAGRLLGFACCASVFVVGYSMFIGWSAGRTPDAVQLEAEKTYFEQQENELRRRNDYREVLDRVVAGVIDKRCTLAQAVDQLLDTERGRDPVWLRDFAEKHPNLSPEESMAVQVVLTAVISRHGNPAAARVLAARLGEDLRSQFGSLAANRVARLLPTGLVPEVPQQTARKGNFIIQSGKGTFTVQGKFVIEIQVGPQ
jgi:hypothetical protein